MPQKFKIVIADTTCFIILDKIGKLGLLQQLFQRITTTPTIARELGKPLPHWVNITNVIDLKVQTILELEVYKGEASAIALALETDSALLVLDDLKGRKLADRLNLNYTGTFGLLLKAKEDGIIDSIKLILQQIQATNFRFYPTIIQDILKQADEQ